MSPLERILYSTIVEEFGGEVCSSQGFSPNCTHVIVGRPSRSEKYLAAIAAGKWVLHTSYLETSQKERAFVEETPYQWGLGSTDVDATPLAMAAVSWRERLICGRKGAFEGWKVFLIMDKVKESGFKRLLEAGAASVVMEPELNLCTHAFVDISQLKSSGNVKVLTKLRSEGVTCLRPEYIAEYLMHQDPPPLINQFIVQDT